mgnify:CR=1 FL=1
MDIGNVHKQNVLLRVDLEGCRKHLWKINNILPTVNQLLSQGASVCLFPSIGPALMPNKASSKIYLHILEELFKQEVHWFNDHRDNMQLGRIYLHENAFMHPKDIYGDKDLVSEIIQPFDLLVHDTYAYLETSYASAQGLLASTIPQRLGLHAEKTIHFREHMRQAKVGVVLGGSQVAWQLRCIRNYLKSLKFVAVGGAVAKVMMGLSDEIIGPLYDDVRKTMALLRQAGVQVIYPVDVIAYSPESQRNRICLYQDLEANEKVMDIATRSRERILQLAQSDDIDTVVLSGEVGEYLDPRYSRNTEMLLKEIAQINKCKAIAGNTLLNIASRLHISGHYDFQLSGHTLEMQYLTQDNYNIREWENL